MESARILLTEDDPATRSVMRVTLQIEGHLVAEAFNGAEAMKILAAEDPPDIVLLDLAMPGMDGFAFLEAVSQMHPQPASRIIVVTAERRSGLARELMDLGAAGFVQKPLRREDLRRIIELTLKKESDIEAQNKMAL